MVKINIEGHKELKYSPFAFGNTFNELNMIDNPDTEVVEAYNPAEGTTVYDCENNPYLVRNKSITEDNNIVVQLLPQWD